jgi:hypothetical protein
VSAGARQGKWWEGGREKSPPHSGESCLILETNIAGVVFIHTAMGTYRKKASNQMAEEGSQTGQQLNQVLKRQIRISPT